MELTTLLRPPSGLGKGTPLPKSHPVDAFGVSISAPSAPHFNEPSDFFLLHTALVYSCIGPNYMDGARL